MYDSTRDIRSLRVESRPVPVREREKEREREFSSSSRNFFFFLVLRSIARRSPLPFLLPVSPLCRLVVVSFRPVGVLMRFEVPVTGALLCIYVHIRLFVEKFQHRVGSRLLTTRSMHDPLNVDPE